MRLKTILIYFATVSILAGQARNYSVHPMNEKFDCNQSAGQDANTTVTFFGDSHGQFVNFPFYGWHGWPAYLAIGAGGSEFNVQNLAVGSWTSATIFERIKKCANENPAQFKTARRYAVETGGNDLISNFWIPVIMPWKMNDMRFWMLGNQKLVLKLLKIMVKAHNTQIPGIQAVTATPGDYILFYSNFPVMARGPISGTVMAQWERMWTPLTQYKQNQLKVVLGDLMYMMGDKRENPDDPGRDEGGSPPHAEANKEQMKAAKIAMAMGLVFNPVMVAAFTAFLYALGDAIQDVLQGITDLVNGTGTGTDHLQSAVTAFGQLTGAVDPTPKYFGGYHGSNAILQAYVWWVNYLVEGGSVVTPVGMMLTASQGDMAKLAAEEGVHFVDVYFPLIDWRDCAVGHCYVANHDLYTEFLHPSLSGYVVAGLFLGSWMKLHGWDKPLVVNGTTYGPDFVDSTFWSKPENQIEVPSSTPPINSIDIGFLLWLWWCLTTGACG